MGKNNRQKFKHITKNEGYLDHVKEQLGKGNNITDSVRDLCERFGLEYSDNLRRRFSERLQRQNSILKHTDRKIKRLFWDIETSPNVVYAWRIGWNITLQPHDIIKERAIISIAYKWEHEDKVHTLTWDKDQCDKKMLQEFVGVLQSADESVAHNGKRFDEKWIRTRCIYHGIRTFPKYKSLDTLLRARQGFNFNSNKLDYIAKFLGVGAKLEHEGFSMWRKIIEDNDKEALKRMLEYNIVDVQVLEDVFHALQHYIQPETHAGVTIGQAKFSCPVCGSEEVTLLKNNVTSKGTVQRLMQCNDCDYSYNISNSSYKHFIETNFNKQGI